MLVFLMTAPGPAVANETSNLIRPFDVCKPLKPFNPHIVVLLEWDKKCYFKKQTGEVIENKGKGYIDSQKQTGKQSGEVVENTFLWKKLTGNKPENKAADLVENTRGPKKQTGAEARERSVPDLAHLCRFLITIG